MKRYRVPAISIAKHYVIINANDKKDAYDKALRTKKEFMFVSETGPNILFDDITEIETKK